MALSYAHDSFEWSTATTVGNLAATISGLSFQPKAIRLWAVGYNSATDATIDSAHAFLSVGFATSASDRRSVGSHERDASAAGLSGNVYTDIGCLIIHDGATAGGIGRLDIDAINSDGFTVIVDQQSTAGASIRVFWEAWGGSDITNATTGVVTEPAATGTQDYTVTGNFQPSVLFFAGVSNTAAGSNNTNAVVGIGAATGAAKQWTFTIYSDDGATTIDTSRYGRSDECISCFPSTANGATNPDARASFVQFNADGFRLDWLARAATGRVNIYLAIKGGSWDVDTLTLDTTTATSTATVSGLSFQPVGASLASHGFSEQAAGTGLATWALSMGCFSSTTSRRAQGIIVEDGQANVEIDQALEYDQVLVFPNVTGAPPGVLKSVDINAVNSDGFQLVTDVGGSTSTDLIGYVAFGDAPAAGSAFPWHYFSRQRAT